MKFKNGSEIKLGKVKRSERLVGAQPPPHQRLREKVFDIVQEIFTDGCHFQEDYSDRRVRGTAEQRTTSILSAVAEEVKNLKEEHLEKSMSGEVIDNTEDYENALDDLLRRLK